MLDHRPGVGLAVDGLGEVHEHTPWLLLGSRAHALQLGLGLTQLVELWADGDDQEERLLWDRHGYLLAYQAGGQVNCPTPEGDANCTTGTLMTTTMFY